MAGLAAIGRQFATYFVVGLGAAGTHYALLIALVEGYRVDPVPATLLGYIAGGIVSYLLHRRVTYASHRPHAEATWRFLVVWLVGLGGTWLLMALFVRRLDMPYLLAQLATTGFVLFWSFAANRFWTFRQPPAV